MSPLDAVINASLPWIIRIAGLFWLIGSFMLFRQIRSEIALDRMTAMIGKAADALEAEAAAIDVPADTDGYGDIDAPVKRRPKSDAEKAAERWFDRDDAARRGWIAGQAVVLMATAVTMMLLHPFAAWLAALLVTGQGLYFFWREWTARRAPSAEAAAHARPSAATINAGWVSLVVAMLVWTAAFRDLLN
ncbi:MAG: hypothetical protein Q7T75_05410 [Mesorhizobium sp.]|nr:hypothetical protein [Mesorhizobium sp.]